MIITFYSFKGGVGRSMAMAACAYLFAQKGLRTLAIDFDLEAPGLERYFFDDVRVLESVRARPGLIDLVLAYKRALTNKADFERADFKQWRDFVEEAIPATTAGGSVDLMTAGIRAPEPRYAEYALAVRSFDWQDFFNNWRGDRFFDWLRRELTSPERGYDVVLVDSRTGVTEMGGVCAYQLADTAVLLCAANYQNLDGTKAIVDDFRSDAVTVVRQGRPIEIIVVPARVEDENDAVAAQRDQFFIDFQRTFGSDGMPKVMADVGLDYRNLALKYHPELAIIERLVDSEALARGSFQRLADALTLLADGGRWDALDLKQHALARLMGRPLESRTASVADVTRRGAGYDVLFDYGQVDASAAARLREQLVGRGVNVWTRDTSVGVDDDPVQELRALEYAATVGVALGKSQPTRRFWELFREAQVRRKRIIPILLPGCDNPEQALASHGLLQYQAHDFRDDVENAARLESLIAAFGSPVASEAREPADVSNVSPYPGSAAFSEDQSADFFGRDRECEDLLQHFADHDIVVMSGASAIGKTSLIQAGLLPRVRRGEGPFHFERDDDSWLVEAVQPTPKGVAAAMERVGERVRPAHVLYVIDAVDSFPAIGDVGAWSTRCDAIRRLLGSAGADSRFLIAWREVLPADQREEALRVWSGARRRLGTLTLEPLSSASIRDVIERPAARAGHLFEPGLVDRLIADCGTLPGAVAQAQLALGDIWAGRRRGWLTNKAYDATGGIGGRFAPRAQRLLDASRSEFGNAAATFFRHLVQLDSVLHVVPRPRDWATLSTTPALATPDAVALRERLVGERLVDVWRGPSGDLLCGLSYGVVPGFIKDLVAADASFMLWRERLTTYVVNYNGSGRSPDALLAGDVLGEAERWFGTHRDQIAADERSLISQSISAHEAQEKRRRRNSRMKVALGFVPPLVALIVAVYASDVGRRQALQEVAQVNAEVDSARQQLRNATAAEDALRREADAVRAQLSTATNSDDRKLLQNELATLDTRYAEAQAQAKKNENELNTLRKNQLVTSDYANQMETEIADLRGDLKTANEERDRQRERATRAETAVEAAQERVAELEDAAKRAATGRSAVQDKTPVQQGGQTLTARLPNAGDFRVGAQSFFVVSSPPFNRQIAIYVGSLRTAVRDARDWSALVVVMPTTVYVEYASKYPEVADPAAQKSVKSVDAIVTVLGAGPFDEGRVTPFLDGRCFADATLSMQGKVALRFAYQGTTYALRPRAMSNVGSDRYVSFDIVEEVGAISQTLCRLTAPTQAAPSAPTLRIN